MLRFALLVLVVMAPGVAPRPAAPEPVTTSTQHRGLDGSVVLGRVLVPAPHLDAQAWPRGMVIAPPEIDPGIHLAPDGPLAPVLRLLQHGLTVLAGPFADTPARPVGVAG